MVPSTVSLVGVCSSLIFPDVVLIGFGTLRVGVHATCEPIQKSPSIETVLAT